MLIMSIKRDEKLCVFKIVNNIYIFTREVMLFVIYYLQNSSFYFKPYTIRNVTSFSIVYIVERFFVLQPQQSLYN